MWFVKQFLTNISQRYHLSISTGRQLDVVDHDKRDRDTGWVWDCDRAVRDKLMLIDNYRGHNLHVGQSLEGGGAPNTRNVPEMSRSNPLLSPCSWRQARTCPRDTVVLGVMTVTEPPVHGPPTEAHGPVEKPPDMAAGPVGAVVVNDERAHWFVPLPRRRCQRYHGMDD